MVCKVGDSDHFALTWLGGDSVSIRAVVEKDERTGQETFQPRTQLS